MRNEGLHLTAEELAHISPLWKEHINMFGRYSFEIDEQVIGGRPLRQQSFATQPKGASAASEAINLGGKEQQGWLIAS